MIHSINFAILIGSIITLVTSDPTPDKASISPDTLTSKSFQPPAKAKIAPKYMSQYISKIPSSKLLSSAISPLTEEAITQLSNAFVKAVKDIPMIQKIWKIRLSPSAVRKIFYLQDREILHECRHGNADSMAYNISVAVSSIKHLTIPLYFKMVANTLIKFLVSEERDIGHHIVLTYADCVKNVVRVDDLDDVYLLFKALLGGFVCFVESCGFDFPEKADVLSRFFINELVAETYGNKT